jgi:predicted deacylase
MTPLDRVEIDKPDLSPFARGNAGVPYVWRFNGALPGPHVAITALMHGNEISGALALARLLEGDLRPARGTLTLAFANVAAFERFDPAKPREWRFIEEDMNRIWTPEALRQPVTLERRRGAALAPLLLEADRLLDLHSMQTASPALMLSTMRLKGRQLAARIGMPEWVVADRGHANGTRLIDFGPFGDPLDPRTAVLLEAGQHWLESSVTVAWRTAVRFLECHGTIDGPTAALLSPPVSSPPQRFVEVTDAVTARSHDFHFVAEFEGLTVVPRAATVLAEEAGTSIRTPYDDCVLVMPTSRSQPGLTTVRLGRLVEPPPA